MNLKTNEDVELFFNDIFSKILDKVEEFKPDKIKEVSIFYSHLLDLSTKIASVAIISSQRYAIDKEGLKSGIISDITHEIDKCIKTFEKDGLK